MSGRWFSRYHSSFDHLPYLFFRVAKRAQYFFVVLTEPGRVESHSGPLTIEHQRQQGRAGLLAIGQRHRCESAGGGQMRVIEQILRARDWRKWQPVLFKYRP